MNDPLLQEAQRLVQSLERLDYKIVFAESCTAGLVAAALVRIPGVSEHLCGTAAVYRNATKTAWLDIPADLLEKHSAVSPEVTAQMAERVLLKTPEADLSAAVTGYLGPVLPPDEEGLIYVAVALRPKNDRPTSSVRQCHLDVRPPTSSPRGRQSVRERQQAAAAQLVVREVNAVLQTVQKRGTGMGTT